VLDAVNTTFICKDPEAVFEAPTSDLVRTYDASEASLAAAYRAVGGRTTEAVMLCEQPGQTDETEP
jgi:hypothetical protein